MGLHTFSSLEARYVMYSGSLVETHPRYSVIIWKRRNASRDKVAGGGGVLLFAAAFFPSLNVIRRHVGILYFSNISAAVSCQGVLVTMTQYGIEFFKLREEEETGLWLSFRLSYIQLLSALSHSRSQYVTQLERCYTAIPQWGEKQIKDEGHSL